MLFNSYVFILVFIPIVWLGYYLLRQSSLPYLTAIAWLAVASLGFYGWWNPKYILLIITSIGINYGVGMLLQSWQQVLYRKSLLAVGITFNLALLGYYKYANFLTENISSLWLENGLSLDIILPLAISFFTFQQIAFLVDNYRDREQRHHPIAYSLFVVFFPQLIAGPIVHHKEMLPQFQQRWQSPSLDVSIGLSIFTIGLIKKVFIADNIAPYANTVFDVAGSNTGVTFIEAWGGAVAYTLQLYFDFSGYADMAIGLGRMFGIKLPINFYSPLKATSIIQFWRIWHITLSRFLRNYIYVPLGGNRHHQLRTYFNLFAVMVIGGIWHGAGWTFVVWGFMHGLMLTINHLWRHRLAGKIFKQPQHPGWPIRGLYWLLTFTLVCFAFTYFRAPNMDVANSLASAMLGLENFVLPSSLSHLWPSLAASQSEFAAAARLEVFPLQQAGLWLAAGLLIALAMPNVAQLFSAYDPTTDAQQYIKNHWFTLQWKPTWWWGLGLSIALLITIIYMGKPSEFIYFQF